MSKRISLLWPVSYLHTVPDKQVQLARLLHWCRRIGKDVLEADPYVQGLLDDRSARGMPAGVTPYLVVPPCGRRGGGKIP